MYFVCQISLLLLVPFISAQSCQNGGTYTSESDWCQCTQHWTGKNCQLPKCGDYGTVDARWLFSDAENKPKGPPYCQCEKEWGDSWCTSRLCQKGQLNETDKTVCICDDRWGGDICDKIVDCGHGQPDTTMDGWCKCDEGWVINKKDRFCDTEAPTKHANRFEVHILLLSIFVFVCAANA